MPFLLMGRVSMKGSSPFLIYFAYFSVFFDDYLHYFYREVALSLFHFYSILIQFSLFVLKYMIVGITSKGGYPLSFPFFIKFLFNFLSYFFQFTFLVELLRKVALFFFYHFVKTYTLVSFSLGILCSLSIFYCIFSLIIFS